MSERQKESHHHRGPHHHHLLFRLPPLPLGVRDSLGNLCVSGILRGRPVRFKLQRRGGLYQKMIEGLELTFSNWGVIR